MRRIIPALVAIFTMVAAALGLAVSPAAATGRASCGSPTAGSSAQAALLSRTIGSRAARQVCFRISTTEKPDTFTVSGTAGHITVRASDQSAASAGAGWYLKYVVHADVGMGNFTPKVPNILPAPAKPITQTSSAKDRYEGNDTQDGYTNPYASWSEWQKMLDMYALHGINEVYVLPGTDAVYAKVLQDFGYTADQARAWVPLPATQPWWVMQNLSNDTAPISQSLLDSRAALGRKIVERCKQLGITPVIPGYFGTVPTDFAQKNSTADNGNPPHVVAQGTWNNTQRPSWLDPTDPIFPKFAADYYKQADDLLGPSSMYRMNPLQEGGKLGGIDPGKAANAIMTSLQAAEPDATWMQLGWQANPTKAQLGGLTPDQLSHLLIADGTTDTGATMPDRDANWPGTNWLFGTIPFGGGQTAMGANGQVWIDRYFAELGKTGSHMTGISFEPEGINDPAAFELMAEMPWHSTAFDLNDWFRQYALGRYGTDAAAAAWSAISTVYTRPITCCSKESPLGKAPSLTASVNANYDTETFSTALPLLVAAQSSVTQKAAYDYDVADVADTIITNWANQQLPKIKKAYDAKDLSTFNSLTGTWLKVMAQDERLLGTVPAFMIGNYVADAERTGDSPAESAALRSNLLHLWTIWFSGSGPSASNRSLQDYAQHVMAGMVSDYYQPRWTMYFDSLRTALENGTTPASIDWWSFGNTFASSSTRFPTVPHGNTVAFAKQLIRLLDIAAIAPPAITSPINGSASATSPASISGTGVADAKVTVTDGSTQVCTVTVAADGSWSCAPSAALSDGSHTLSVVESDVAGHVSHAATVTFAVGAAPSLVDNWKFDAAPGGVVADDGSGHFDATVTGSTTLVPGKTGNAAKYDGTVSPLTTAAPNLGTPWAVGAWVNPSASSHSANLLDGPRVTGNSSLKIQQNTTTHSVGATAFYVKDYAVDYTAPLNTWTYLTYVDDGQTITIYANGTQVGVIPASFPLSRADIGSNRSDAGLDTYNGLIDDMSVFGNSLTPDQVAALYKSAQTGGTGTE